MKLLEKLLHKPPHKPPHKSIPFKETSLSWIKWIKRFCANTPKCRGCKLNNLHGEIVYDAPIYCRFEHIICSNPNPQIFSARIIPEEPPEETMKKLEDRSYVDSILYQS